MEGTNSRDESKLLRLINLLLSHVYCSIYFQTWSNWAYDLSCKLTSIYAISFIIGYI
jgi:hypothetical protein